MYSQHLAQRAAENRPIHRWSAATIRWRAVASARSTSIIITHPTARAQTPEHPESERRTLARRRLAADWCDNEFRARHPPFFDDTNGQGPTLLDSPAQ